MYSIVLSAAFLLAPPADQPAAPVKLWSPTQITAVASQFCDKLPPSRRPYALFISLHDIPAEDLVLYSQVTGGVVNSLSKAPVMIPPVVVPGSGGRLLYWDTTLAKIDKMALARLGLEGSGAAPFPDPFFHLLVKTVGVQEFGHYEGKEWVTTSTKPDPSKSLLHTIHGPWLNPFIEPLALSTVNASPIYEVRWFWSRALDEPRYHEILGLGETIDAFKKVFRVDDKTADLLGSQTRGVALDSEVALQSRVLERTPTLVRFGRGTFHQSYDFKTSLNAQDPLKNLLIDKFDANESIQTLFNGLQAYYVNDGAGKRLDKADADIAQDSRTRLKDHQVRTGFHCMGCHEPEKGIIAVKDEARASGTPDIELISQRYAGGDRDRGQKILEKYFTIDLNELIAADQQSFDASVQAATTLPDYPLAAGLSCAKYSAALQRGIWEYVDRPVDLAELAVEVGSPEAIVQGVIERSPGLDHALVNLLKRPQRRDQIEAAVGPLLVALSVQP